MIKKNLFLVTLFLSMNIYAQTQRIEVLGMVCAFCAQGIEKSFSSDENIKDVFVNLKEYFVVIESKDGKSIDEKHIRTIVNDAGYDVRNIEIVSDSVGEIRERYDPK